MNVDRAVLAFAGAMVLASAALTWLFSPYWLLLTVFVGLNMLQASFTGFCPAALIFGKLGVKTGCGFYDYNGRTPAELACERDRRLLRLLDLLEEMGEI